MSVKSVFGLFSSFLAHHVNDLQAVDTALSGILQAVPVNDQTRQHIQAAIDNVRDSAVNVANAVAGFETGTGSIADVTINEADIEAALKNVLPGAIAAYMAVNPVADVDPAPVSQPTPGTSQIASGGTTY